MGQTPAKQFPLPTPFGSSPQTNSVSETQAPTQVSGPGFAATGAYDQTQQPSQQTANPNNTQQLTSPLFGGGLGINRRNNPFLGMFNQ